MSFQGERGSYNRNWFIKTTYFLSLSVIVLSIRFEVGDYLSKAPTKEKYEKQYPLLAHQRSFFLLNFVKLSLNISLQEETNIYIFWFFFGYCQMM